MRTSFVAGCAIIAMAFTGTQASLDLTFGDDDDLTNFVTRPEIRMPKFEVNVYDAERVTPGYWFLAPYAMIFQEKHANKYYQPCQTGPTIYDSEGELVWSGACQVRNQNTCDFRAWQFNDSMYTSAILTPFRGVNDPKGHGIIMDNSFNTIGDVHIPSEMRNFNMHELNLVDHGTRAIHIIHEPAEVDFSVLQQDRPSGWILDVGFREIDLMTGETVFEWWAARGNHVSITESTVPLRFGTARANPWNWFHGNSVEKSADGDYLLSSRFTDTIFKISGHDGSIMWRLGGTQSSFSQDFAFSRQHDARWLSIDGSKEVISFLDNSSDDLIQNANISSARVVELDLRSMTARAMKTIPRPDGGLTRMRGNHQTLPNENSFICWSENSYLSEHGPEGDILMEAKFSSHRFVTYRAYKFNYTSVPNEPPTLKAVAYGTSPQTSTTVLYVSWNGATEVDKWRFKNPVDGSIFGEKRRTGFETTFQINGFHSQIFAEAIAVNGSTIGVSEIVTTVATFDWNKQAAITTAQASSVQTQAKLEPTSQAHESESTGPKPPGRTLRMGSDEALALMFTVVTILMLCVSLWLWRCSDCGRSSVRLRSDRGYSRLEESKDEDME